MSKHTACAVREANNPACAVAVQPDKYPKGVDVSPWIDAIPTAVPALLNPPPSTKSPGSHDAVDE